jgi:hypothetical protein
MIQRQRSSLDDLLTADTNNITFEVMRLNAMLSQVTDIATSLEEASQEYAENAREEEGE